MHEQVGGSHLRGIYRDDGEGNAVALPGSGLYCPDHTGDGATMGRYQKPAVGRPVRVVGLGNAHTAQQRAGFQAVVANLTLEVNI